MDAEPGAVRIEGFPIDGSATRALNGVRLAVLGILVTIALGTAALAPGMWRLPVGVIAFVLTCAALKWPKSQNQLMIFAHWVTGL